VIGGGRAAVAASPAIIFTPTYRINLYCSKRAPRVPEILSAELRQTRLLHQGLHLKKNKVPTIGQFVCGKLVPSRGGEISVESQFDKRTIFHIFLAMEDSPE
jgi:hypothetical protein